ncbi:MAG: acyl-[acyl-carrier-protein]--UDP-N-acetylglucosamine O-acyltransferase, partial [Burkholderiales bacterium]
TINALRSVYRELFLGDGIFEDRFAHVVATQSAIPEVRMITDFIEAGQKRGLCLPRQG